MRRCVAGPCQDEIREALEFGLIPHFSSPWNWVDTLRIGFFISSIAKYTAILNDPTAKDLVLSLPEDQIYVDFSILIAHNESYIRRCSITIVLCLMSVLKYLRHSQTYGKYARLQWDQLFS